MNDQMNRFGYLDSLRGVAALLVLWMHGAIVLSAGREADSTTLFVRDIPHALQFGRIGVVIFFALSGYLIARSLERDDWKISFPIKRVFRLYPIYIASILAMLLLLGADWSPGRFLANLTMVPTLLGQDEYMGLYWTLQTEVVFYFAFYLITWFRLGSSVRFLFVASVLLNTLFILEQLLVDPVQLDSLHLMIKKLPQHLAIMFWGACLYRTERSDYLGWKVLLLTGYLLLPSFVALGEYAQTGFHGRPPVILSYIIALSVCYLVFYFRVSGRVFEPIGRVGYSVYLNHAILLFLLAESGIEFGLIGGMILFTTLTLILSWMTYRLIEEPAIRASVQVLNSLKGVIRRDGQ